jgi:hypothetical protein
MKKSLLLIASLMLSTTLMAATPKKNEKKPECKPSKEVVCKDSLKGKERPTPKKKKTEAK